MLVLAQTWHYRKFISLSYHRCYFLPKQQHVQLSTRPYQVKFKSFVMQISIQSLEVTHNKIPYRFIVKKVFNTSRNEVTFHCWAPDDNIQAKELIQSKVLMFEWDEQKEELRPTAENPLCEKLTEAIKESFSMERA